MEDGPSNRNARKKLVPAVSFDQTSDNTGLPLNPFDKGKGIEDNPIQKPSFAI